VNRIQGVGKEGAHQSRIAAMKRRSVMECTSGHRCSSSGRRWSAEVGEACGLVSCVGGGREVAGIGAQLEEDEATREELAPGALTIGSASEEVLVEEGMRAVRILGLDNDGEVRIVAATVDSVGAVESKQSVSTRKEVKMERRTPSIYPRAGIRALGHVGAAVVGAAVTGGNRHRWPQHQEHGHQAVTGTMVGARGSRTGVNG
jgi:hypothetical protein